MSTKQFSQFRFNVDCSEAESFYAVNERIGDVNAKAADDDAPTQGITQ